ncbi:MAG: hypothetical protein HXY22_05255 [Alphaproteobacteria bacterium]|nr:hypothetical protein [Alphaproteobacteria bacterium]
MERLLLDFPETGKSLPQLGAIRERSEAAVSGLEPACGIGATADAFLP